MLGHVAAAYFTLKVNKLEFYTFVERRINRSSLVVALPFLALGGKTPEKSNKTKWHGLKSVRVDLEEW